MRALLSVYDKQGIVEFARVLEGAGLELISTGGTLKALQDAGLKVRQVAEVTGSPEILDGRVKTLHPTIHGGLLARRSLPEHVRELEEQGIVPIDVVVNNLYPFAATIARPDATLEDALENIDIGGPTMIRSAAKNFPDVVIVVDPADYGRVGEMIAGGGVPIEERRRLSAKAFQHVALYDTAVSGYLRGIDLAAGDETARFPAEFTAGWQLVRGLRYGENPHQSGALYGVPGSETGVANATQLHGPGMGYVNYLDAEAAWKSVAGLPEHGVSIIKHATPCGLAVHEDQAEAYRRAFAGDTVSAYGGIAGFNTTLTAATAEAMRGLLLHVVVAPDFEPEALEMLKRREQCRVLRAIRETAPSSTILTMSGGALIQTPDLIDEDPSSWKVVTKRAPTPEELADLAFAWEACRLIKSNTIVLARDRALIGMGAGQPNRVTSVHLALRIAGDRARGTVLASDAFFPFTDGIEMAIEGGVTAVAQPGGSIRDDEVIAKADEHGLAMVFTGIRHFYH